MAIAIVPLPLAASEPAALPGVTELRGAPHALTDATLNAMLGDAVRKSQVVALGETAHGSAGFLQLQARLVRYLVEQHGVRLVVWETGVLRSLPLSRWLEACRRGASSPPPVESLYMPTRADLPLFAWLCRRNRAHPQDPVVFRGMDVWDRPWEHYARLRASAAVVGLSKSLIADIAQRCPGTSASGWAEVEAILDEVQAHGGFEPREAYRVCRVALAAAMETGRRVVADRKRADPDIARDALEVALSASTLLGWLGFYDAFWTDDIVSWNARDAAQGHNLDLLLAAHDAARAVLAAHSSHVSHGRSAADWWGYGDLKSGVHFFTRATGRRVLTIAMTGYDVSGTQGHWVEPQARNSIDRALRLAGHEFAFFTSRAGFLEAHRTWWLQNGNTPGRYQNGVEIVPADHFDAYFFFRRSYVDEVLQAPDMWRP